MITLAVELVVLVVDVVDAFHGHVVFVLVDGDEGKVVLGVAGLVAMRKRGRLRKWCCQQAVNRVEQQCRYEWCLGIQDSGGLQ
jgi:hypothetical protein